MTEDDSGAGIRSGRLSTDALQKNFADAHPALTANQSLVESDRCYFCYDAPCIQACPTGIDIPSFIRKISTGNIRGAAHDILEPNIFGAMCARVCPTEVLCEGACVRNLQEHKPVAIGALQRYATDWLYERDVQLFSRAPESGRSVAVVGGGPAGLSCAHRLAKLGHHVTVFEARDKLGGLNEYGVAAYKVAGGIARREVEYLLQIGNIESRLGQRLGRDVSLRQLRREFDAVFLGIGLGGVNELGIDTPQLTGVYDAIEYIENVRQTQDLGSLPVGRAVVVVGGGMTAIDIATQIRRLGAEDVTIVYRRGAEQMGASTREQSWAQTNGVRIKHWARPVRLLTGKASGKNGGASNGVSIRNPTMSGSVLTGVEFETTRLDAQGQLRGTGERFTLAADMLFKAIGQVLVSGVAGSVLELVDIHAGRIAVDEERRTSLPGVWAGGDCAAGGKDLTVVAVEDGKRAAHSIDSALRATVATGGAHG